HVLSPSAAAAQSACDFRLGFKAIADRIPAVVGSCLEDEHFNLANGDSLQQTSRGLLVWRKADNFTAFTDGYRSWVNGPYGLQQRLNSARFSWEAPASSATVAPAVYSGVGAAASQPELDRMGSQFFSLLNTDRKLNGLQPLALNGQLSSLAQTRAQDLL